jgi:hypothetical protein
LESPESFSGKRIEVTSDELTLAEVAKVLTGVLQNLPTATKHLEAFD